MAKRSGNSVVVVDRHGRERVLLNPQGKRNKAFAELQNGVKYTNDGKVKLKKNGQPMRLTDTEAAYRSGYIAAQNDSAKAYKHNQKKKHAYAEEPVIVYALAEPVDKPKRRTRKSK